MTARRTSWIVLLLGLLLSAGALMFGTGIESESSPGSGLGDDVESVVADRRAEAIVANDDTSALLVYRSIDGALGEADLAGIAEAAERLVGLSTAETLPPPQVSDDERVAAVLLPLEPEADVAAQAERADEIRGAAAVDGLEVFLTGAEGFEVDLAAVFEGADVTLLLVTAAVVAVLLLVTYRSPWLWLVPLVVIGTADVVAGIVAARVSATLGYTLDASVNGILSVLVFGAGTNYALLLIARYRDELRRRDDRREAMSVALRASGPAIIASGTTVALSLLTLLLGELSGNRALGLACAVGIVVAMAFALVVLPAALVLFGRGLFWPYVPRVGSGDSMERSPWARLGRGVRRRPTLVAIAGTAVLCVLAAGVVSLQIGLSSTEQFLREPEAVSGQAVLADAFPAGSATPAVVVLPDADVDDGASALEALDGIESAAPAESARGDTVLNVVLEFESGSEAALGTIERMRSALDDIGTGGAVVGGTDATNLDSSAAQDRDRALLIPLILALVFLVLVVLLRALVAPVLLLATVVASFFASLGASWLLFQNLFGFPALDGTVLLLAFLFLVALGVDYNIFLVTRAKEEAEQFGSREGMLRALAATGGVITSAGILLAAVFAVLGVLPLIALTQTGIIVCIGVLLDTLLVRTLVVPALAFLTGDRFWWPGRLSRGWRKQADPGAPAPPSTLAATASASTSSDSE